jgi:uncharacterized protein
MGSFDLAVENLTSPPVLAFVLGAVAVWLQSDLRLPDPIHTWLSTYLLLAIGLKGGHALKSADLADVALPALVTVLVAVLIPVVTFAVARTLLRRTAADAGAIAAHYGSVSVVTFTAATVFAAGADLEVEPFMTALVAVMEVPGILVALVLATARRKGTSWRAAVREVLTGRSVLLLAGGILIGAVGHDATYAKVEPLFVGLFTGLLTLFLLDMGAAAASALKGGRSLDARAVAFGVMAPIVFGVTGVLLGHAAGLGVGGAAVFGAMVASASYIAAPAATRLAIPDANPGLTLGLSLGVTFPFNLALGIPLFFAVSRALG